VDNGTQITVLYATEQGYEMVTTDDWDGARLHNGRAWRPHEIDPVRRMACMIPAETMPSRAGSLVLQAMVNNRGG
jgi:hypothetical protein